MKLTKRQKDIIKAIKKHGTRKKAAEALGISPDTVDSHMLTVFRVTGVKSFEQLLEVLK
jgi:DNA-binding CsgD family transcriptional regulator